jgi:hypothetical protein
MLKILPFRKTCANQSGCVPGIRIDTIRLVFENEVVPILTRQPQPSAQEIQHPEFKVRLVRR